MSYTISNMLYSLGGAHKYDSLNKAKYIGARIWSIPWEKATWKELERRRKAEELFEGYHSPSNAGIYYKCLCGNKIIDNYYLEFPDGSIRAVGSECYKFFTKPNEDKNNFKKEYLIKSCDKCKSIHRNRKDNLCNKCRD